MAASGAAIGAGCGSSQAFAPSSSTWGSQSSLRGSHQWPHLDAPERAMLGQRIGVAHWAELAKVWPALQELPELIDLGTG